MKAVVFLPLWGSRYLGGGHIFFGDIYLALICMVRPV